MIGRERKGRRSKIRGKMKDKEEERGGSEGEGKRRERDVREKECEEGALPWPLLPCMAPDPGISYGGV